MTDPTQRFTNRVAYYHAARPRYPAALLECLQREAGLTPESIVADIGSGTGISSEIFLRHGNTVYAVEPNDAMRAEAETHYGSDPNFKSVAATAEATTLPAASVDLVAAGQAFHWFKLPETPAEFKRILKPDGYVCLFWNSRQMDSTPFLTEYEDLLKRYSVDYNEVNHRSQTREKDADERDKIQRLFGHDNYRLFMFPNQQATDEATLIGRALSSSYVPLEDHPNHAPLMAALRALFAARQQNGQVMIEYTTEVFLGRLD
jgi:ubiquinone/menaquinone biosynthesis C-methylase UbiE